MLKNEVRFKKAYMELEEITLRKQLYIYMLFTGCEVRMRKTVPEVLKGLIQPLDNNNDYIRDRNI